MGLHRHAERAARAVYGTIIALATLAAFDETASDPGKVVAAMIGAVVAAQLAEIYAQYIAHSIRRERRPEGEELHRLIKDAALGSLAALIPVVPFALADLGAIRLDSAFDIAPWAGIAVLAVCTEVANRAAGLSGRRSVLALAAVMGIGLALVALKVITG